MSPLDARNFDAKLLGLPIRTLRWIVVPSVTLLPAQEARRELSISGIEGELASTRTPALLLLLLLLLLVSLALVVLLLLLY
jgi:hypothetical protein